MSAVAKRKPLTAGTVKGEGVRPGRRISKHKHYHNTTKKKIRQIIRVVRALFNTVRPVLACLSFFVLFGMIGEDERSLAPAGENTWAMFKMLIIWIWLMKPYLMIGNGGKK